MIGRETRVLLRHYLEPPEESVQRFETPPGHQAQVDFAEFRLPWGKRYALIVVLGYSRLMWVQYYERQTMAVVMRGLESAFRYFRGVPSELLFDQMKPRPSRPPPGTLSRPLAGPQGHPAPPAPARGRQVAGVRSCKSRTVARFQPRTSRSSRPRAVLAVTCLTARITLRARSARAMPTSFTGLSAAQRAWRVLPSVCAMASYVLCRTPSRVANVTATYARSDAGDMTASLVTSTRARYPFRSRFARRIVRHPGSSHPSRSSSRRQYRSDRSQHPRDAAHSEADSARAFRGRCKPLSTARRQLQTRQPAKEPKDRPPPSPQWLVDAHARLDATVAAR